MKFVILIATLLAGLIVSASSANAFAESIPMTGYGSHSEFCTSQNNSCQYRAMDVAKDGVRREIARRCDLASGAMSEPSCTTACNPVYIPANTPPAWVTCNATCTATCQK